jgi:dipeptidyl aminopeptidase/acylaminoacyl peptidase
MSASFRARPAILVALLICSLSLAARQPYKLPPREVVDILDAPPPPDAFLSPDGNVMLLAERSAMPSIADLARPMLRLAGLRISPDLSRRQQLSYFTSLTLKNLVDGSSRPVELMEGIRMDAPTWSPDGRHFAFLRTMSDGVEIWVGDAGSGKVRAVTAPAVNAVLGPVLAWMPDGRRLLATFIVEGRGPAPAPPPVPDGPNTQETGGKFVKSATYQDLLKTARDEDLFEYHALAQLAVIDAADGAAQPLGRPGLFAEFSPAPDGRHLLVTRLKRPFSLSVPFSSFARTHEVWDESGKTVFVLADLPPAEEVPLNGVAAGPRRPEWQPGRPATLIWAEALDGGDPEQSAPFRDRLMSLAAPFQGSPRELARTKERFETITWLGSRGLALVQEFEWKKSWRTTSLIDAGRPDRPPRTVFDLNAQDSYKNPGRVVMTATPAGCETGLLEGEWIYLQGEGASPQGSRPFLDRFNIRSLEKRRIFQSAAGRYEMFIAFQGESRRLLIVRSESPSDPPNVVRLDIKTGQRWNLTDYRDPAPSLTGLKKQLVKYKRSDGVDLSATLYLPPGHDAGTKLPAVVWAYPREFTDAAVAGQVRASPDRFTFFRGASHLFFLLRGYAVLDGAEMPIIGDPKTVNDTYVRQLSDSARAAVEALRGLGVADTARVGVGGHSYGAFMTANLLAHTDLFAAGIARSGAYNRTLTPFGFQNERRTLWEAPESYINMSPFMHATKINEPLLLIHGEADNNSGTFPIQSERLFAALRGFGAVARLVMLPLESHGYSARESVLHVVAEMLEWFDEHVKNKKGVSADESH